jgi:6-phosphofructokinase 1
MDAVLAGRFGEMVALRADEIVLMPLADATKEHKLLDPRLLEIASVFFG